MEEQQQRQHQEQPQHQGQPQHTQHNPQQSLEHLKMELIASLPNLLADSESSPESLYKAAEALDIVSAAACAAYLLWPEADRRRAVLRLAQQSAGQVGACMYSG